MRDIDWRTAYVEMRELHPELSEDQCMAEVLAMNREEEEAKQAGMIRREATQGDFETFFSSAVWRDLQGYFQGKLLGSLDLLTKEEDYVKLYKQQGSVSELSEFVNLPNLVKQDLLQQEQKDEYPE